jgi:phage terminase large subunit-like protein
MKKPKPEPSRGEKVCAFIEKYCRAPEGALVGQPIVLQPFQRKFILDVYDNPHGTHTGILSIGRKNGKTALIAGICLAHIAGPEAVRNSQIVSGAMSKEQASILFKLMVKMINFSPELSELIRIFPSGKKLLGLRRNVEYAALAAEGKTTHGLSPILAIMDELGQVKGPTDEFVTAVETAQGAYDNPLYLVISTQAPTANDLLSRMIDAQQDSPDPHVVCHVYAAPDECDLDDEAAWRAANPALGVFRSLTDLRKQIAKAKAMPSQENGVRNLILNQRVDAVSPFVSRSLWQQNGAPPEPPSASHRPRVYGGLDLASVSDLTAAVLVSEDDGGVYPFFWLPEHDLKGRAERDKVPYDQWEKEGFLLTTPGKAIQYKHVAAYLRRIFDDFDVILFGFDRYLMAFLREWLQKEDKNTGKPLFSQEEIDKFVEFGQGTASMTPALRDLEVKLVEGQLKHGNHPVLTMCAANARVVGDSGARKFDKRTARGRIDGMVALAIAVGVMPQPVEEEKGTIDDYLADTVSA